jgi:hypothetical protein
MSRVPAWALMAILALAVVSGCGKPGPTGKTVTIGRLSLEVPAAWE